LCSDEGNIMLKAQLVQQINLKTITLVILFINFKFSWCTKRAFNIICHFSGDSYVQFVHAMIVLNSFSQCCWVLV